MYDPVVINYIMVHVLSFSGLIRMQEDQLEFSF